MITKKSIAVMFSATLCFALLAGCGGDKAPTVQTPPETSQTQSPQPLETPATSTEVDYARLLMEIPADADVSTTIKLETRNFKHIQALKLLFDEDSYLAYNKAVTKMKKDKTMEAANAALEARNSLIQTGSIEDRVWFIWDGTTMPLVDGESFTEDEIDASQMFGYGFEPFAIKYLVEDQSTVKGNIIACSGGGMLVWSNGSEGYPAAKVFNDLGYNYFLLQRRVGPYSEQDIFMDYQRFVRVVKHHAEQEGYGGQDMFAALGWSGGAGTLLGGVINELYGDLNPTKFTSNYVPDAIDAIDSDVDVALVLYGTGDGRGITSAEENKNLPAFYICVGSADGDGPLHSTSMYNRAIELGLPAQLNIINGAEHGFGVGLAPATGQAPGTELWPSQADEFMQENLGFQKNTYGEGGEIEFPEASAEYTKAKSFYGYYILQDSDVLFAMNEDESRFCVKFYAMAGVKEELLEGAVVDGICTVDPGFNGLFGEDVQLMYEDAMTDEAPWAPIKRS